MKTSSELYDAIIEESVDRKIELDDLFSILDTFKVVTRETVNDNIECKMNPRTVNGKVLEALGVEDRLYTELVVTLNIDSFPKVRGTEIIMEPRNRSCNGCIYKPKAGENYPYECGECSRFYADGYESE